MEVSSQFHITAVLLLGKKCLIPIWWQVEVGPGASFVFVE
jgi:hypothetical protein